LLQLVGGLDRPTSGEVVVRGTRLAERSEDGLALYRRQEVGFIFQFFNLVPTLTALQNIELPLTLAGLPKAERGRRAGELLERVGLGGRRHHRPNQLSGGEQQRVAIARALINRPAIVLADEPTGNLDTKNSDAVLKMLRQSSRELNQTVLMITHNPEAAQIADRILHMRDGEITHIEDGRR
ncbi:MAG TPA: ABC transporter ATP-binding protein, partial [Edaphobacter sp.]|nr:ABC transporter ATP-binding protein [Edaphobacter sp.]